MKTDISGDVRIPIEDVAAAIREGRDFRPAHLYRIIVADEQLNERYLDLSDPVPTGRQILQAAEVPCAEDCSIYAILPTGEFEDLRLDELYDLRGRSAERFVIFQTDRAFKFMINGYQFDWGKPIISGWIIKSLAGVDANVHDVWQDVPHGDDRRIENNTLVDLSAVGVEKFTTRIKTITIIVNGRPREISQAELSFLNIVQLAFPNAVINETTVYTVTFKRGSSTRPEDSLVEGQSVHIKNGEVFNVTSTDKS